MANKNKYPRRRRVKKATEIVNEARVVGRAESLEHAFIKESCKVVKLKQCVDGLLDVLADGRDQKKRAKTRLDALELMRTIERDQD